MSAPRIKKRGPGPRELRRYQEALAELNKLMELVDKLSPTDGDTVLFKLEDRSKLTQEMLRVFLDVNAQRGVKDLNAFLMAPGDAIETLSQEQFDALAKRKGYVRFSESLDALDKTLEDANAQTDQTEETAQAETAVPGEVYPGARQGEAGPEGLRPEEVLLSPAGAD
jgi:hypothetical protein